MSIFSVDSKRHDKNWWLTVSVGLGVLAVALGGCQSSAPREKRIFPLMVFSKHSVDVEAYLEIDVDRSAQLVAVFTPSDPTLHLYGKDMPRTGIDGVGRPTRLAVVAGELVASGELMADVAIIEKSFPIFDEPFPLYPDGPVRLTLPVTLPDSLPESTEAVLSITYMACSSEGSCKPPVTDHHERVALPLEIWQ